MDIPHETESPIDGFATAHANPPGDTRRYRGRRADPAALRPQPARDGAADAWTTPACLIEVAMELVQTLPPGPVWECAAGELAIVNRLREQRKVLASDNFTDTPGVLRHDFLEDPPLDIRFAAIVSNPPFNQLNEFIRRGLALMGLGYTQALMLLLRKDHPFAAGRAPLLLQAAELHNCCWRPYWLEKREHSGRWSFLWAIWRAGFIGDGPTAYFWIPEKTGDDSLRYRRLLRAER